MTEPYRLAVIKDDGATLVVAEQDGALVPLHEILKTDTVIASLDPVLADWQGSSTRIDAAVSANADTFANCSMAVDNVEFAIPFAHPGTLICIGANYHDHVAEMPEPMTPEYPYSFIMPTRNTLRASGEAVAAPEGVACFDFEAELAVIIGRQAKNLTPETALDCIAGYMNFNDLSARDWIASRPQIGMDWVRHKAHDGFGPIGPFLVPARYIPDPQNLPIRLSVNGVTKQDSSTARMIYGVVPILCHLSSIMTLFPGDIIATGTPAGVGHGRKPPEYLKPGDIVRLEIGPLGELVTPVV